MELTIIWFAATIVAIVAFIFALVSYIKVSDLEKQVDEISDGLDVLTDLTVDTFEEFEERVDKKFDEVLDLFNDNHIVHDKMIKMMESLIRTDESLYEYIQDVEKAEQFDRDDLYELFTGFFGEEVEEWEHPVDDWEDVCWDCRKVWEDDFSEYWESRTVVKKPKTCPKADTCKKEPCKDTCPKKRGRPAKK